MARSCLVRLGKQRPLGRLMPVQWWGPVHSGSWKELAVPPLLSCSFCTIFSASLGRGLHYPPWLIQGLDPSHQVSLEVIFLCTASPIIGSQHISSLTPESSGSVLALRSFTGEGTELCVQHRGRNWGPIVGWSGPCVEGKGQERLRTPGRERRKEGSRVGTWK